MKIYKKYDSNKNKQYNILAKEYLQKNNINIKYYVWIGMAGDKDIVKTNQGYFYFNINTKKLIKQEY